MLTLPEAILTASFDQVRRCGSGRRECVTYWCASLDRPDVLTHVVHPVHTAVGGGYEVDDTWVMEFFKTLHHDRRTVRVQIHSHPRGAGHSWIDDAYALVPAEGFFSLVIPDFGQGPVTLDRTHLVELTASGDWAERDPSEVFTRA